MKTDIIEGVPVIMLANKQDVEGALKLHEIKEIFNQIAVQLEARDSKVLCVSALTGYLLLMVGKVLKKLSNGFIPDYYITNRIGHQF
jgi:hypothetical protein